MKGIIFNILEEAVSAHHGADFWDDLLDKTQLAGAYTSLGSYSDEELVKLVMAIAEVLAISPNEALRWFGQKAMPIMARRYPVFFTPHTSTRAFLLTLNDIIHADVKKLYPEANVPIFDFQDGKNGALFMTYHSARKLCALAQGFTEGAAAHFHESIDFQHRRCMHHGDSSCLFYITLHPQNNS